MKRVLILGVLSMAGLAAAASAADFRVAGKLISDVPTGTRPLEVSSTTKVTNLNADLLNGLTQAALDNITDAGRE